MTRKFIALKAEKGCRADRLLVKSDAHVVGIALLAGVSQGVVELDHLVSTVEGHLEYIRVATFPMASSFRGCIQFMIEPSNRENVTNTLYGGLVMFFNPLTL